MANRINLGSPGIISIMVHALRSRRVITPAGERDAIVVIDGECIAAVLASGNAPADLPLEDLGDVALLPGLVDVHTHLNEPGRTEWEGFAFGTRAAAAGGFTTIADMPLNCLPETTNTAALTSKREAAQGKALVDYALWGGAVNGNSGDLAPLAAAGVFGFKCFLIYPGCDGFGEIDREHLRHAAPHLAALGLPLLAHAEFAGPIDRACAGLLQSGADWKEYSTWLASRPDEAELDAIAFLLSLCRQHRFTLHIVHLSTAKALPMLRAAKQEGLPVTVETCPHYLHFAAEAVPNGSTLHKCAPPIRSAANREQLWQALLDGTIDLIATDHSPCPPEMKRLSVDGPAMGRFDDAWGGIASLSVALPVLWTECLARSIPLQRLVHWLSAAPAHLLGLSDRTGQIATGYQASLVAFDTEARQTVQPGTLHQRHCISPYMGEDLSGVVLTTWVRGTRVFHRGTFSVTCTGREHIRSNGERF